MTVPDIHLLDWLHTNAGPVVRWRIASELCPEYPAQELNRIQQDLLASPLVRSWLDRLTLEEFGDGLENLTPQTLSRLGLKVHGSKDTQLENVLGKLAEFGLCAGMPALDQRMAPLPSIFHWQGGWKEDALYRSTWESLVKCIFAWGLLRTGYQPGGAMQEYLYKHLERVYKIARDQVYDLYASGSELAGLPKAWGGKPILRQEIMSHYHLPLIHDIYLLAYFPPALLDARTSAMIDTVVAYILDPRFQALPEGYGYAWIKERHTCYSWGWSPHLSSYHDLDFSHSNQVGMLVQHLELMARFSQVQRSTWFNQALAHLESFRTEQKTYRFPGRYLREAEGYYVSGYHMGLGENRHKQPSLEIESTVRMLTIKQLVL